ncbi:MAG: Abi family protein [Bacteroidales bacterium]|nr:Abi family protein [Bacteroidales bacterium]
MARTLYTDSSLSVDDQIALLKSRGLAFWNEYNARHILQNVSMFRMKGYLYPLQSDKVNHIYKPNATFEQALEMYRFDSSLRRLLFKRIEQIEVSIRTKFSEIMANATDHFWYTVPGNFNNPHNHSGLLNSIQRELSRSDDDQIVGFFSSYTNQWPPSWMAMEVSSFGTLSLLYKCVNAGTCKRNISNYYGLRDTVFESWIHSLVYVRNICGHHSRLWNRNLRIQPVTPRRCSHPFITQPARTDRVYYVMCIIRYLLNVIEPGNNFTSQINWLFIHYPSINKRALYFPNNWETEPLWQ